MPQGRKIYYLIGLSGVMLVVLEVIVYVLTLRLIMSHIYIYIYMDTYS